MARSRRLSTSLTVRVEIVDGHQGYAARRPGAS